MNQFTYIPKRPVNMDRDGFARRAPLANQDPNTHGPVAAPPPGNLKPVAATGPGPSSSTGFGFNGPVQRTRPIPLPGRETLRYLHDSTTSIPDRLSGWQGPPPSIREKEEGMKREADRLAELAGYVKR